MERTTASSVMNFFIQTASFAAFDATMYSASIVESVVELYLELFQTNSTSITNIHKPRGRHSITDI